MMYVSRHIYLLGAALVNLMLGLYLRDCTAGWRRVLQAIGSVMILLAPVLLALAFFAESPLGLAGRSWRTANGIYGLFAGAMLHLIAIAGSTMKSAE